jgi:hypothetical protein
MRRAKPAPDRPKAPAQPPEVHTIDPNAIYFVDQAQALLRLTPSTIRREHREGRLRVSKRAGRYYILGKWLIEWLEGGELRRQGKPLDRNGRAS